MNVLATQLDQDIIFIDMILTIAKCRCFAHNLVIKKMPADVLYGSDCSRHAPKYI